MAIIKRVLPNTPWKSNGLWKLNLTSSTYLLLALVLFGLGEGLLVVSQMGSTPWTVLAQGLSKLTNLDVGFLTFICKCRSFIDMDTIEVKTRDRNYIE